MKISIDRAIEILNPEHRENYDGLEEIIEACRMGMEALQYRKAMPPVEEYTEDRQIWYGRHCPRCGWHIRYYPPCCENCGQEFKWPQFEGTEDEP